MDSWNESFLIPRCLSCPDPTSREIQRLIRGLGAKQTRKGLGPHLRNQPPPLHAGGRVRLALAATRLLSLAGVLQGDEDALQRVFLWRPGIHWAVQCSIFSFRLHLHSVIFHNCGREERGAQREEHWAAGRSAWFPEPQVVCGPPFDTTTQIIKSSHNKTLPSKQAIFILPH